MFIPLDTHARASSAETAPPAQSTMGINVLREGSARGTVSASALLKALRSAGRVEADWRVRVGAERVHVLPQPPVTVKLKALLALADRVRQSGPPVTTDHIAGACRAGATELEIHDTVRVRDGRPSSDAASRTRDILMEFPP
jgi:hypothetical protein